ncbi:hypothetical protein L6R53_14320 [Myxococcota bacterium]|nr:hypothetical protein [Myxococcota bacterium]
MGGPLSLLLALGLSGPARAGVVDRVAAVVNDDVVTLSEVYELGAEFTSSSRPRRRAGAARPSWRCWTA